VSDDDWRRAEAHAGLADLPPAELAWEFLRRNPRYRADYQSFIDEVASGAGAEAESRRFARWGLTFRRRSGGIGARTAALLAP
jgi:hypothetical protein